jgi:hypothetical protein
MVHLRLIEVLGGLVKLFVAFNLFSVLLRPRLLVSSLASNVLVVIVDPCHTLPTKGVSRLGADASKSLFIEYGHAFPSFNI